MPELEGTRMYQTSNVEDMPKSNIQSGWERLQAALSTATAPVQPGAEVRTPPPPPLSRVAASFHQLKAERVEPDHRQDLRWTFSKLVWRHVATYACMLFEVHWLGSSKNIYPVYSLRGIGAIASV